MTTSYGRSSKRGVARRLLPALSALIVAALVSSAPAGAVVTTVSTVNGNVSVGLQPRNAESVIFGDPSTAPAVESFDNPLGNPVVHSGNTYVIYWDPTDHYHGDWQNVIDKFLQDAGSQPGALNNIFAVNTQYVDKTNQHASGSISFRGAYTDTNPYPLSGCVDPAPLLPGDAIACLTDLEVQQQLASFISQHGLQKGMGTIFYVLTPPGVTVCLDGGGISGHCSSSEIAPSPSYSNSFCSYHSAISPTDPVNGDANTILYATIPWTVGGRGDGHLLPEDQTNGVDCQDGGFDPNSKPFVEAPEHPRELNGEEKAAFEKMSLEEQAVFAEERLREGPHEQQPNQTDGGPDGSFDHGLADPIINQIAVEHQNAVINPLLNGWKDPEQNESTDECRNFFAYVLGGNSAALPHTFAGTLYNQEIGTGIYYLNKVFNAAAYRLPYPGIPCVHGVEFVPKFTAPNPVNVGDIVGFDGMESNITLDAAASFSPSAVKLSNFATYVWDFGDGSPVVSGFAPGGAAVNSPGASPCAAPWLTPCAASTFHSYQYGGTYTVTLTVTDVGGNVASVTHDVTVVGPPAPGAGGSTGGAGQGGGITEPLVLGPVAHAAAAVQSLASALRKGLLVRYSVNEEVAGHFEVLMSTATARRLKIHGTTAKGLPKGTVPSIVIGRAILVTTKGGHASVRIKFSKATVKRLHGQRKVSLTLRLIVRNAAAKNPATTTVISKIVLHR